METHLKYITAQIAAPMHSIGAQFDPEVLQWPSASVIALLLLFRATVIAALESLRLSKSEIDVFGGLNRGAP